MPQTVRIPRLLGAAIEVTGYRPETVIAEKGVTILERGTTSTRWRDYIDTVQLPAQYDIDKDDLRRSAEAVADYRNVDLKPISPVVKGYGAIAQTKWAARRRKEGVEDISEEKLDDQVALVATVLDPVLGALHPRVERTPPACRTRWARARPPGYRQKTKAGVPPEASPSRGESEIRRAVSTATA